MPVTFLNTDYEHLKENSVNEIVLYAVISLGLIGVFAAVVLYIVAQKFKVIEDPKIDEVADLLPELTVADVVLQVAEILRKQL